jgi:hypothetical protein
MYQIRGMYGLGAKVTGNDMIHTLRQQRSKDTYAEMRGIHWTERCVDRDKRTNTQKCEEYSMRWCRQIHEQQSAEEDTCDQKSIASPQAGRGGRQCSFAFSSASFMRRIHKEGKREQHTAVQDCEEDTSGGRRVARRGDRGYSFSFVFSHSEFVMRLLYYTRSCCKQELCRRKRIREIGT